MLSSALIGCFTVQFISVAHRKETQGKYIFQLGLLDYDKNHNHDYFGQYCNHDYLKLLFVGHMTKALHERFI